MSWTRLSFLLFSPFPIASLSSFSLAFFRLLIHPLGKISIVPQNVNRPTRPPNRHCRVSTRLGRVRRIHSRTTGISHFAYYLYELGRRSGIETEEQVEEQDFQGGWSGEGGGSFEERSGGEGFGG